MMYNCTIVLQSDKSELSKDKSQKFKCHFPLRHFCLCVSSFRSFLELIVLQTLSSVRYSNFFFSVFFSLYLCVYYCAINPRHGRLFKSVRLRVGNKFKLKSQPWTDKGRRNNLL
jgi:hypothetical protein